MQAAALVTKTLPSGVLRVSMCRPKANAMTVGLMEALSAALHDAAASSSVRGVVVTSELPKTFSAGLDVTEVHDLVRGRDRAGLQQYFTAMDTAFRAAPRCPKPVVAALDGHAVAGGLMFALTCDTFFVNSHKPILLGLTALKVGIPYPALPVAIAQHQLPRPAARRVLFDPTLFPGDSAVAMGVGSPSGSGTAEEAAVAWLDTVCSRPPAGFAATKQLWWRGVLSKTVDEVEREEWVDAILSPHCEAALANALNATRQ